MITFNGAMKSIGLAKVSDTYLAMLNLLTHKFVMIPVMVATGFSMALIPVITEYYAKKDQKGITRSLRSNLSNYVVFNDSNCDWINGIIK